MVTRAPMQCSTAAAALVLSVAVVACASGPSDAVNGAADTGSSELNALGADASPSDVPDADSDDDDDGDVDAPYDEPVPNDPPPAADVVGATALLAEMESIVSTLKSTHYQHTSHIDPSKGTYDTDCSGLVNYAMAVAVSDAYDDFRNATVKRPVADSYVKFIGGLAKPVGRWQRVTLVANLLPGDILAWTIPKGVKSSDTGHVMIVEKAPVLNGDQADIAVIDSTDYGHGDSDPRTPNGANGVGRGTTVVMMNKDGTASGYRWSMDSDSPPYVTDVVMAHLD